MEGYRRPLGSSDINPPERRILLPPILHIPDPRGDDDDDHDDDDDDDDEDDDSDDDDDDDDGVNAGLDVIADVPMRRELWQNVIGTAVVVAILVDWTRNGIRRCAIWANILDG